jgi:hypothetical protein
MKVADLEMLGHLGSKLATRLTAIVDAGLRCRSVPSSSCLC